VLVEPRPARVPRDGRTMMEKAQERKIKVILEGNKGIVKNTNPFSALSTSEVLEAAECTGVRLGNDQATKVATASEILDRDKDRVEIFDKSYQVCQDMSLGEEAKNDMQSRG
jgi:hypothetical protein